jgi:HrpA-like RNA helicase
MPLPTLLIKGSLLPPDGNPALKAELDEWVPLDYIIDWFRTRLSKTGIINRVLILKSETASGKSTAIAPEIYKKLIRGTKSAGVICTQPRVATAVENVIEMLKWNSSVMKLGEQIGWSTKYNKFRLKSVGLLSATIGTLAQQLRSATDDEIIRKYKYIMIDETHERDLQTDMTIAMLKSFLYRNHANPECPFVVLMSATFDPVPLLAFFSVPLATNFIWCGGMTAKIDEMWDWNEGRTVNDYPRAAATVVEKIIAAGSADWVETADILIFMPGKAEFTETVKWLTILNAKLAAAGDTKASTAERVGGTAGRDGRVGGTAVFSLLQIDGPAFQTQNRDFMLTVRVPTVEHHVTIEGVDYVPARRVIISTNVAETGLTLDNLKYVIDSGFNREIEFNPILGIRALVTKPAPRSRIRQRRGRAGRKFDGVFYPLYPKHIFDRLPVQQYPQILIEDVCIIMLDIIDEQLKTKAAAGDRDPSFSVNEIDMVDIPTPDALAAAVEKLYMLGFVSMYAPKWEPWVDLEHAIGGANDATRPSTIRFGITMLGQLARRFSMLSPESVRMILSAYYWDCSVMDAVTIAAYISIDPKSFVRTAVPVEDISAIPPKYDINWLAVYKLGLPGWISSPGMLYKVRLLIGDEFIHGLILFNAVKQMLASSKSKDNLLALGNWCETNNLSLRGCLDLIRARDDIIEQMLTAGMEVFAQEEHALSRSTQANFMTIITKIKYCIYDGFRCNMIVRSADSKYRTLNGLEIMAPKLFRDDEAARAATDGFEPAVTAAPTYVLYKELSIKANRKSPAYDVIANTICVLDGFVSPDMDFVT